MTKAEAERKAAELTAAGTPTAVRSEPRKPGGYATENLVKRHASRQRYEADRMVDGRKRDLNAAAVASGAHARGLRDYHERERRYAMELFSASPEKRVRVPDAQNVVVLSDLQIPFEDCGAVSQALERVTKSKPDTVILNGDIVDCYAESSFEQDYDKAMASIPETYRRTHALLQALRGVPQVIWLGGNHEDRWRRLLWSDSPKAKLLLATHQKASGEKVDLVDPVKSFAEMFQLSSYGVAYYPYSHRLYLAEGNLVVTHGKYVSRHSGQAAKRTWEWLGKSVIVGHTHRLGAYLITQDGREMGAWENGCLCQLEPEYDDAPNWQQGFSIVRIDGPAFHVMQVPIVIRNGKPIAVYNGEGA